MTSLGRPLRVDVAQGQVEALGTRFTVQVEAQFCEVAVLESAVLVRPAATAGSLRVNAGEQLLRF